MKYVVFIIILVVVVIAGLMLFSGDDPGPIEADSNITPTPELSPTPTSSDDFNANANVSVVVYTDDGFDSKETAIKLGKTVVWDNQSGGPMWIASDVHPVHSLYPNSHIANCSKPEPERGAIFDACTSTPPGESWSFTFNRVGSWAYHNHRTPSDVGIITVVKE